MNTVPADRQIVGGPETVPGPGHEDHDVGGVFRADPLHVSAVATGFEPDRIARRQTPENRLLRAKFVELSLSPPPGS